MPNQLVRTYSPLMALRLNDLCAALVLLPVVFVISGSLWLAAAGTFIGYCTSRLAGDWRVALTGPMIGLCICLLPIFMLSALFPKLPSISMYLVLVATIFWWLVIAKVLGQRNVGRPIPSAKWLVVPSVLVFVHALTRQWDTTSTIDMIQSMGEDNGYFLRLVADTSREKSLVLQSENLSGGVLITGAIAVASALRRLSGDSLWSSAIGNAETLQRVYDASVYLCLIFSIAIFISLRKSSRLMVDAAALLLIGFSATAFASGLLNGGHLSTLVAAVVILGIQLGMNISGTLVNQNERLISILIPVLLLSQTWFPLAMVSVLMIPFLAGDLTTRRMRGTLISTLVLVVLLGSLAAFAWRGGFLSRPWAQFSFLMEQVGGEARVIGWFSVVVFFGALLTALQSHTQTPPVYASFVLVLCVSATALMVLSWLVPPFEPQYGPNKYLYLITFVVVPVSVTTLSNFLPKKESVIAALALLTIGGGVFQAAGSPMSELSRRLESDSGAEWTAGLEAALSSFPNRQVLCIETRADGDEEYDAYRCSRLAAGMQAIQGQVIDPWWNLCAVPSEQIALLPDSFWRNVTILVSDGNRLSSNDGCQARGWAGEGTPPDSRYLLGWASGIRWDLVEIIAYDGSLVRPSFEFLKGESDFTPEEVSRLDSEFKN